MWWQCTKQYVEWLCHARGSLFFFFFNLTILGLLSPALCWLFCTKVCRNRIQTYLKTSRNVFYIAVASTRRLFWLQVSLYFISCTCKKHLFPVLFSVNNFCLPQFHVQCALCTITILYSCGISWKHHSFLFMDFFFFLFSFG